MKLELGSFNLQVDSNKIDLTCVTFLCSDDLREHLKAIPKTPAMPIAPAENSPSSSSSSSSSSDSSSSSSGKIGENNLKYQ
jgi:hypothetical protein